MITQNQSDNIQSEKCNSPQNIRVFCRNGLTFDALYREILLPLFLPSELAGLTSVSSLAEANLVVSYPYGSDFSRPKHAISVAYICENVRIGGPVADFHFYVSESDRGLANGCHIQWHGVKPSDFSPPLDVYECPERYLNRRFCNFIYAHRVPYRERLFDLLSRYKHVDAPSLSRNNMAPFDDGLTNNDVSKWQSKRDFLSQYKFTLAAENDIFRGYQTEKLYDPIRAHSIPIYVGDPYVGAVFNAAAFTAAKIPTDLPYWVARLEEFGQIRLSEISLSFGNRRRILRRIRLKGRSFARDYKNRWYLSKASESLVRSVIEVDNNPELYLKMLSDSKVHISAANISAKGQTRLWVKIFKLSAALGVSS